MESTSKEKIISRAALVAVVLMMAVCFAVAELLILNFGQVGLHRFTPRVSVMRLSFYAVVLGGALFFHKRIERFLIENQCLRKSKIGYFLACFAILLCTFFFYLYEKRLDGLRPHLIILATLAVLFILWAVGIVFIGDKVENNFLAVSISLLPLFSFLTKASHGVDEPSHFSEAYSVMMGHFFNLQYHGILPPALLNLDRNIPFHQFIPLYQTHFDYGFTVPIDPTQVGVCPAGYPSVFYFPSAIGLWLGKLFHFTVMSEYISGRLANCIAFIVLAYLAIRIMPVAKNIFSVVLLAPYMGLLAGTYSIDGIGTALILLFAALCFYDSYQERELTVRDYLLLLVMAVFVLIFKREAYSAALLFLFLIPLKKLLKRDAFVKIFKIACPVVLLLCVALACVYLSHLPVQFSDSRGGSHVNASQQFVNMIKHPVFTFFVYLNHVRTSFLTFGTFESMIANDYFFGIRCNMASPVVALWFFVAATDHNAEEIRKGQAIREKLLLAADVLITPALLFAGMYMIFCNVGSRTFSGLQPRYLYPIMPFLLMLLNSKKIKNTIRQYSSKVAFCSSLLLVVSLAEMVLVQ